MHDKQVGTDAEVGFGRELKVIAAALASVDDVALDDVSSDDIRALVEHLQVAEEELRVADEEVRAQHDEVRRLIDSQQARRWQHERLLAVLPSPLIVTNRAGQIKSVNAAAAAMVGMGVNRLLRRPIQTLMDPADRPAVRRELATAIRAGEGSFRRQFTLSARAGEPAGVEAVVSVHQEPVTHELEVTWLLLATDHLPAFAPEAEVPTSMARALVALTQLPLHASEPDSVLRSVVRICKDALGGSVEISVTVGEPLRPRQVASTGRLAQRVDGAQVAGEAGPSVDSWRTQTRVVSADLLQDERWDGLSLALKEAPVRAVVAVPVAVGEDTLGVMTVYGSGELGIEEIRAAELLSTAVAAILNEFEVRAELESAARNYRAALTSRAMIDQAKGILMAKHAYTADLAFEELVRLSSVQNRKLREIAAEVVAGATRGEQPDS